MTNTDITITEGTTEVHGEFLERSMTQLRVRITRPYQNLEAESRLFVRMFSYPDPKNNFTTSLGLEVGRDLLRTLHKVASHLDQNWDFLLEDLVREASGEAGVTPAEMKEQWAKRKLRRRRRAEARAEKRASTRRNNDKAQVPLSDWQRLAPYDRELITRFCERSFPVDLSDSIKAQVFNILLEGDDDFRRVHS